MLSGTRQSFTDVDLWLSLPKRPVPDCVTHADSSALPAFPTIELSKPGSPRIPGTRIGGGDDIVEEAAFVSSAEYVLAIEPVIRRVVAARVANPSDIDDLVQDCLERLLAARGRLTPEAVLPYAVVTARNLVTSHARSAMRHAA